MTSAEQPAQLITLGNAQGLQITCMDFGATWVSCKVPTSQGRREVLLGGAGLEDYQHQSVYLGQTIGRYANRIADGHYEHNGRTIQLATNHQGNTLHGGPEGFDRRIWKAENILADAVTFTTTSPDSDQGFPGEVSAAVTYQVHHNNSVTIDYRATCSLSTPLNFTNHAYFNLIDAEAGADCRAHRLRIAAALYLPVNSDGIPDNGLQSVNDTRYDFRQERAIDGDYDHAFLLESEPPDSQESRISLTSADDHLTLDVYTDKPAIQLYTGRWLTGTPNRHGSSYGAHAGVALETQFLPDSPNHADWPQPDCFFSPERPYHFTTRYEFST